MMRNVFSYVCPGKDALVVLRLFLVECFWDTCKSFEIVMYICDWVYILLVL